MSTEVVPGPLKEPNCAGGWICDPVTSIRHYFNSIDKIPFKEERLECPEGYVCGMSGSAACSLRKNAPAFKCLAPGNFQDPKSCTFYHHCWVSASGNLYSQIITCSVTEYYSIKNQTCISKLDSDCDPL